MQETCLYVLKEKNRPAIKIGISNDVDRRGNTLFEDIDWENSRYVTFSDRRLARKTESFLHVHLSQFSAPKSHGLDGYTEWFHEDAYNKAISFLEREKQAEFICCSDLKVPLKATMTAPKNIVIRDVEDEPFMFLVLELAHLAEQGTFMRSYCGSLIVRNLAWPDGEFWVTDKQLLIWNVDIVEDYCVLSFSLEHIDRHSELMSTESLSKYEISFDELLSHQDGVDSLMARLKEVADSLNELDSEELEDHLLLKIQNSLRLFRFGTETNEEEMHRYLKNPPPGVQAVSL